MQPARQDLLIQEAAGVETFAGLPVLGATLPLQSHQPPRCGAANEALSSAAEFSSQGKETFHAIFLQELESMQKYRDEQNVKIS